MGIPKPRASWQRDKLPSPQLDVGEPRPAYGRRLSAQCAAVAALLVLALSGPAGGTEPATSAPLVTRVEVKGSITRTAADLLRDLATRPGRPYDPWALESDIRQLWGTGRYASIRWEAPVREDGGVALTLVLEERPRLTKLEFRGNKKIGTEDLKSLAKKAGLSPGPRVRYDEAVAHRVAREIEARYREKAYFLAKASFCAEPYEGEDAQGLPGVKLVFKIEEGRPAPVKGFRFVGNRAFSDAQLARTMRAAISAQGGDPKGFDRLRYERALREINQLYKDHGYLDARVELAPLRLYTWEPPGETPRQWLVPQVEIYEGPVYTIGKVTVVMEPVPKGPPPEYNEADLLAVVTDPPPEFAGHRPFREGEPYSGLAEAQALARLKSFLGRGGRVESKVQARRLLPEKGSSLDVEFVAKPSQAYRIVGATVRGNHKTRPSVFLRELYQAGVRPGELADSRKLELAMQNIRYTGLLKDERDENTGELVRPAVNIRTFPRDEQGVDIVIDVNEGETGALMAGGSVNSNGELAGQIEFSQRNFDLFGFPRSWSDWTNAFTGAGQSLSLSASWGTVTNVFKLDFEEPWFLGLPLRLHVGLFDWTSIRESYKESRDGASVSLGHSWSLHQYKRRRLSAALKWRDEFVDIFDVDSASAPPDVLHEDALGKVRLRRAGASITFDSRDSRWSPSEGSYASCSFDTAGGPFGGDKEFTKTELELQHHIRLGKDRNDQPYTLQFKAELGVASPRGATAVVPFYERYYAGGFGSLRGFKYRSVGPKDELGPDGLPTTGDETFDPIGGNVRLLETVEYTFPLSPDGSLRGAVFYDAGNVWADISQFDFSDQKQSAGIGLLIQPAGFPMPISLYLGWIINKQPEDKEQIVSFMIGTMFF